ncbi:23S rRNA (adenine(2030)-N(6))-methyltransferase RlmJ [Pseudotabrizicola sp. L79]|uniref:23S rRNA (adenine(2030)-N(6))-methyltransferase RlmJ n=1 Tax=Pseudotabrizicola sp. L79 TaxID=3118402 RepID=UPI002F94D292
MLSYQHHYHAGNLADVHKHAVLAWVLNYLIQKDKPLTYMESHAGRGLYDLNAAEAIKTGEAAMGIARAESWFAKSHPYARAIAATRAERGADAYPGSPLIAGHILRETDTIHLCELHPQEHAALDYATSPFGAHVYREEGLAKALSICPPTPRRGMLLIDPSYEIKTDYETLPRVIGQIARKWNVGIIALWYPILAGHPHFPMVRALKAAHPGALAHEVSFPPAREGHRMTGSGMFIINPPFGLEAEAKHLGAHFHRL